MNDIAINVTWKMLIELEPRLIDLERRIKAIKDNKKKPSFCANWFWYSSPNRFRNHMSDLVGWDAEGDNPILKSSKAYDVAYEHLYSLLPNCRNCICW